VNSVETSFTSFISNVVVARLIPVLAAFCILKAALDAAEGQLLTMLSTHMTLSRSVSWCKTFLVISDIR